jgi:hypothetical protein
VGSARSWFRIYVSHELHFILFVLNIIFQPNVTYSILLHCIFGINILTSHCPFATSSTLQKHSSLSIIWTLHISAQLAIMRCRIYNVVLQLLPSPKLSHPNQGYTLHHIIRILCRNVQCNT